MPLSGAARPSRSESNVDWASPPTLRVLMTLPTEPTVTIRPQNVPSRPRKTRRPGHVARNVARLVEPGGDRIENAAHHGRGDRHPAHAVAEDRGHRGEQDRRPIDGEARIGEPEAVDPFDLRKQPDDLPEGQQDADQQHEDDHRVEQRHWTRTRRRSACRGSPPRARTGPGTPSSGPEKSGARTASADRGHAPWGIGQRSFKGDTYYDIGKL